MATNTTENIGIFTIKNTEPKRRQGVNFSFELNAKAQRCKDRKEEKQRKAWGELPLRIKRKGAKVQRSQRSSKE
jgi:hypothetical protein